LAHPRFHEGKLTTNFIAEEYPDGFNASDVQHDDPAMMAAIAGALHRKTSAREMLISGQMSGATHTVPEDWVVIINQDESYDVSVIEALNGYDVKVDGAPYDVRTNWNFGDPLFNAVINNQHFCVQVDRLEVGYRLTHAGTQADCLVLTPRGAELNENMPIKEPPDLSKFLLSPMPGVLVSVAVEAGQEVKAGEELAVVEAMKMENVLKATIDGTVKTVEAAAGESLKVDQIIIEFE